MGVLEGFRTGFGAMQQHYNRQDRLAQQQESNRRYDQQMGLQTRRMDMAEQSHNAQIENYELTNQLNKAKLDYLPVKNAQDAEAYAQKHAINEQALASAKYNQDFQEGQVRLAAYVANGDGRGLYNDPLFSQQGVVPLVKESARGKAAIAAADAMEKGDLNGAMSNANTLFKPWLNRMSGRVVGKDGSVLRDVEMIGVENHGNDDLYRVKIRAKTDKGQYVGYLTNLRSADENDPVKLLSGQQIFGTLKGAELAARLFEQSGIYDEALQTARGYLSRGQKPQQGPKPEWFKIHNQGEAGLEGPLAGLYDPNTNTYRELPKAATAASMPPEQRMNERRQVSDALTKRTLSDNGINAAPEDLEQVGREVWQYEQDGVVLTPAQIIALYQNHEKDKAREKEAWDEGWAGIKSSPRFSMPGSGFINHKSGAAKE